MPRFRDLPNEVVSLILSLGDDWATIRNVKLVSKRYNALVSGDLFLTHLLQLGRRGMQHVPGASQWSLERRSKALDTYVAAATSPDRYLTSSSVLHPRVRTRHVYTDHHFVCAVTSDTFRGHLLHVWQLGSPLSDRPFKCFTPSEGRPLLPDGALDGTGLLPGNIFLETVVLDPGSSVVHVVYLRDPTDYFTRIVVVTLDIVTGKSWTPSSNCKIYDPVFYVGTRDFKRNSRSMCSRGGQLMFAAIGGGEDVLCNPADAYRSEEKAVYVRDPGTGEIRKLAKYALSSTFLPSGLVAILCARDDRPCAHVAFLQFEIHAPFPSPGQHRGRSGKICTLLVPVFVKEPCLDRHHEEWNLLGREVGLPVPRGGLMAGAGAFGPDGYAIIRQTFPTGCLFHGFSWEMEGMTVPMSVLDLAADACEDPDVLVPISQWDSSGLLQVSAQVTPKTALRRYRPRRIVEGSTADGCDFHPGRVQSAAAKEAIPATSPPGSHTDGSRSPSAPNESTVWQDGYLDRGRRLCCGPPDPSYHPLFQPPHVSLPSPRDAWRAHPMRWVYDRPNLDVQEIGDIGVSYDLCGDAVLEYPGSVVVSSMERGAYIQYGALSYRPLTSSSSLGNGGDRA